MGAWDWDIVTGVETWDETVVALYGLAPGVLEGSGDRLYETVHPEDLEAHVAAIEDCVATGVPFDIEFRVVRSDGSVAYLAERGRVTHDAAGTPVRMSGVTWDVTQRTGVPAASCVTRARIRRGRRRDHALRNRPGIRYQRGRR